MPYQVNACQRYVWGTLRICLMENAFKGTHDASEAFNSCSKLLQHNDHIALMNTARDLGGYIT